MDIEKLEGVKEVRVGLQKGKSLTVKGREDIKVTKT